MATATRNKSTSNSEPGKSRPAKKTKSPPPSQTQQTGTPDAIRPIAVNRPLAMDLHPDRLRHVRKNEKIWVNGTILHYYFFQRNDDGRNGEWAGSSAQKSVVRKAFRFWKDLGMGLEFQEVANREEAEIRIGFDGEEQSWSYVGRDAIDIAKDPDERTINFGQDITSDDGAALARQAVGFVIGFTDIDPRNPESALDSVHECYPPLTSAIESELKPYQSRRLRLAPGQQENFRIRPQFTRNYKIQTFGQSDAVLVLFEDIDGLTLYDELTGELEYLCGDDDSGEDRNACITTRLYRDREYVLRLRLCYSGRTHGTALLLW